MLHTQRDYIIDKVKKPLMKALIILSQRYPEPTIENCKNNPNSPVWLRVWDRFFEMEDNPGRNDLFRAIRKVMICEFEHDSYYRDRGNVLLELWLEEVLKGNWTPRLVDHPPSCWKVDPAIRGTGYKFMEEQYAHK